MDKRDLVTGRVLKLNPNGNIRIFVKSINDHEVNHHVNMKIDMHIYGILLANINKTCIFELRGGVLEEFITTIKSNEIMINDKLKLIVLVITKEGTMTKGDIYNKYCTLTDCSYRTAQRHLKEAIDSGLVNEIDNTTVEISGKTLEASKGDIEKRDTTPKVTKVTAISTELEESINDINETII